CSGYRNRNPNDFYELGDILKYTEITSLNNSDPLKIWVTVDIPATAQPGNYTATIKVKQNGTTSETFNINFEVVDKILPTKDQWTFHLDLWQHPTKVLDRYNDANPSNKIAYWSASHLNLLKPLYRILADKGQKVITAHIKEGALGAKSMITWTRKVDGTWVYDFNDFDNYVNMMMGIGINQYIQCQSLVGWNRNVIPFYDEATLSMNELSASVGTPIYLTRWNHFLTSFKAHLNTKGWFNKTVLYMDEVPENTMTKVISMIRDNDINWKIGLAINYELSKALESKIFDLSSSYSHNVGFGRPSDKIGTVYTPCGPSRPNNFITGANDPADNVWFMWYAKNKNYDGFLRWAYDYWVAQDDYLNLRQGNHTSGDFALSYRSSNTANMEFYSSIRLELIRDGIQDWERIKILQTTLTGDALATLNNKIDEFSFGSANITSKNLVISAQQTLKSLVSSNVTQNYCVAGGSSGDYYVESASTTGGNTNIAFTTSSYPLSGYEHNTNTMITVFRGDNFTFSFANGSNYAGCSRVKMWIDWNADGDFDDPSEEVYANGLATTCNNNVSHSVSISVPVIAALGKTRIRIKFRDAWRPEPEACGVQDFSGAADFDLEVLELASRSTLSKPLILGLTTSDEIAETNNKITAFPNPIKSELKLQLSSSILSIKNIKLISMDGRLILNKTVLGNPLNEKLDISTINSGIYIIKIKLNDGSIIDKKLSIFK
ncbi:MAG: glycoside hydrolase domain-containing protein, partial [Polaribacter sp.]